MTAQLSQLPLYSTTPHGDWLLGQVHQPTGVFRTAHPNEIILSNGLVARRFRIAPNGATVGLQNLTSGEEFLRAVKLEAILEIDGKTYEVGGLKGQPDLAYLRPDWLDNLTADPNAFHFDHFELTPVSKRFDWKQVRRATETEWPPEGAGIIFWYQKPDLKLKVAVHYEAYDGLPLISKWITVYNEGDKPVRINKFVAEQLGFVEPESYVDSSIDWTKPNVTVLTDFSFAGMSTGNSARAINWLPDKAYTSQVNYELKTPCLLEVKPPIGPDVDIQPGKEFESFRVFELLHDNWDRERHGLAVRKMMRKLAPWSTENPLMLHLTSTEPKTVHTAIDQAAECGFEMIILSFGSGLDMENVTPENIAKFKEYRDYAKSKGLDLGGYSLLASRHIDDANDVISPKTGKPGDAVFGFSPCLGSQWGIDYFAHMRKFIEETGFSILEHDGSYPGDVCASTTHPGHHGLEDSQWTQFQTIKDFYHWCRERGVFLNVPDFYFLTGSNKTGMGYREDNWSLPRDQQHIHARQNLFDGTWDKAPSMGWMFVPLVEYHGGGAAATIEPLHEHLHDYEMHLANNLGYGAQACYRGPRLYDSPEVKQAVIKWVSWFKQHRDILESDVIHVKRADGQNLDCALHVNPMLPTKAMAVIYNPTKQPLQQEITLPLYYSGLSQKCSLTDEHNKRATAHIDREYKIKISPKVPAESCTWITITQ